MSALKESWLRAIEENQEIYGSVENDDCTLHEHTAFGSEYGFNGQKFQGILSTIQGDSDLPGVRGFWKVNQGSKR